MKPQTTYPVIVCLAIAVLGFVGAGAPAGGPGWPPLVVLGLSLLVAGLVSTLLYRMLKKNQFLVAQLEEKAHELESQYAELQFERTAIEEAAAENINMAEDLFIAREEAENNARFLNIVMDNISQAIAVFGPKGSLIKWNGQLGDLLSIPVDRLEEGMAEDAFNRLLAEHSVPSDDMAVAIDHPATASDASDAPMEQEWSLDDGRVLSVRHTAMPGGGFIATFTDITERKRNEEVIWKMAHYDHLTGLANRARFTSEIEKAATGQRKGDGRLALAMIDLDKFKPVNDRYGHPVGDKLLKIIADIISSQIRERDLAARIGGDEFAILFYDMDGADHAVTVAERIIEAVSSPFNVDSHEIKVGASIGIAVYPEHADSPKALIAAADDALYSVKDCGRGAVAVSPIRTLDARRKTA